tara:strand:+ start:167 stop:397 length:231 start_codon:yes stop_codon:yes gene_type:complete
MEKHWDHPPRFKKTLASIGPTARKAAIALGVEAALPYCISVPSLSKMQTCVSSMGTSKPAQYSIGQSPFQLYAHPE